MTDGIFHELAAREWLADFGGHLDGTLCPKPEDWLFLDRRARVAAAHWGRIKRGLPRDSDLYRTAWVQHGRALLERRITRRALRAAPIIKV